MIASFLLQKPHKVVVGNDQCAQKFGGGDLSFRDLFSAADDKVCRLGGHNPTHRAAAVLDDFPDLGSCKEVALAGENQPRSGKLLPHDLIPFDSFRPAYRAAGIVQTKEAA